MGETNVLFSIGPLEVTGAVVTMWVIVAVLALLLNSRHIFYGLSFIDKFRSFGPWRWFLIYSLCDENYSLHCSHDFGPDVNEKWAYVLTAAFVTFYWVALSMLGGLVGSLIPFDTTGIDFALTALFTVIVVDQLRGARTHPAPSKNS